MVEIPAVVRGGAESICIVDDQLRFVVQFFDGTVVDRHPEVVEDAVFVATHRPSRRTWSTASIK